VADKIRTVGVAGSGTMGAGIAIVAARAGFRTVIYDTKTEAIARARKQTEGFFAKSVERRKLSQEQVERIMADLTGTTDIAELAGCDIVIEAVYEDLKVKHELLGQLHRVCPPHTIFASNTSTLSITEIAAGSGRDERFVGMHFCLPAQLMKLVEMSPGLRTSAETFQAAWDFCKAMGQVPVKTQDNPGFILNYFLVPFNNDAIRLVESGVAEPAEIDRAIKTGLGYPMGPLELLDLVGLDTHLLVAEALYAATHEPRAAVPPLVKRMIAAGRLGRKTGAGFYTYTGNAMFGG
jgi:3-hydroxybutyryl-CoA dehydrogenase